MRTNLILLAIAALLAWPCWKTHDSEQMVVVDMDTVPKLFPGFRPEEVTVVEVIKRKPDEVIEAEKLEGDAQFERLILARTTTGWKIASGHLAEMRVRAGAVERDVLEHVASLRVDKKTVIEADADEEYLTSRHLTPNHGTMIRCRRGAQAETAVVELILGKSSSSGRVDASAIDAYFVVRPDQPRQVILYEPTDRFWRVPLEATEWADKTIHRILGPEIDRFHYTNELGTAAFRQKAGSSGVWEKIPEACPPDSGPPRQSEVGALITHYEKILAENFYLPKMPEDQVGARIHVQAVLKSGATVELWIHEVVPGKSESKAISSECPYRFGIANYHVNPFERDPKDLFDPAR